MLETFILARHNKIFLDLDLYKTTKTISLFFGLSSKRKYTDNPIFLQQYHLFFPVRKNLRTAILEATPVFNRKSALYSDFLNALVVKICHEIQEFNDWYFYFRCVESTLN